MNKSLGIAIVGCGVVGSATARHILEQTDLIRERYGISLNLAAIIDRDLSRARAAGLPEEILTKELDEGLGRDDIDIVVELVGGTAFAFSVIESALTSGKHVVTANKALLAHRGADLFRTARAAGKALAFEGSCGGGIPLIRALTDGLGGNRIDAMYGIVNGTCNFILSEMLAKSVSYDEALREAQELGLAEADPTLDVTGRDSAHKIAIMSSIAFGTAIDFDRIPVTGIDTLDLVDVSWAVRLGYVPKLLAVAERSASGITIRVQPSFVHDRHPLAWVGGPFNAVSIYSYPTGHTMHYGRGAGGSATSGAIVADIVSIGTGAYPQLFAAFTAWPDTERAVHQNAPGEIEGRYFVRSTVEDIPGMMGELAACYGRHGISLASVHQDEISEHDSGEPVPVVVVTHHCVEDQLRSAVDEIDLLPRVHGSSAVIAIVDEPEEPLMKD